jgi:choline dehydrogenase-like flavoprotein
LAFHDARRLDAEVVSVDVCIVGGGAAGITLAQEFAGQSTRVALIESGDFEFQRGAQALYGGNNIGLPNYATARSRWRRFGGSTTQWNGKCRPLDTIDFEVRDGIAHSGWPFDRAALEPYYRRAQRICSLGRYDYSCSSWLSAAGDSLFAEDECLESRIFQFGFPRDFGQVYRAALQAAGNIDVYLHANLIEIELDAYARQVTGLCVATLSGRRMRFVAATYVLACGGIENARLLLASNRVASAGVGNGQDLVGRFFMDHPYFLLGHYQPARPEYDTNIYAIEDFERVGSEQQVNAAWSLNERTLREQRLNGSAVFFVRRPLYKTQPEYYSSGGKSFIQLIDVLRRRDLAQGRLASHAGNLVLGFRDVSVLLGRQIANMVRPRPVLALQAVMEATPNPVSRVTLGERRDRLGMPRVRVDWRLNASDQRGLRLLIATMQAQFARRKLGPLIVNDSQDAAGWPISMTGGRHHMGTTRMHADERQGVVDANCRVHGCANLYIAGSSLFPTGGYANPTLTIVALAVRLADHLKDRRRSASQF